jgi:hypothetical protein
VVAPPRDKASAPTQHISKEEKSSHRSGTSPDALISMYEKRIIELAAIYTVSTESGKHLLEESDPFVHGVELHGPKGEIVRLRGVFDDGASINAIDTRIFAMVKHRLNKPYQSDRIM